MANDLPLHRKSVAELSAAIATGALSPRELTDALLARIERENPSLNAFVTVCAEEARRDADRLTDELARGRSRGPLHGIPIAVKDLMDTEGVRTTYGSSLFREHVPTADAEPITRLRAAGAIVLGKANTHEFACGATTTNPHYGATHNPWRHGYVPGGSSGGSAAALAAGLAPLATGSDTGGSIRMPSALCGVVGLKPTHGRVSLRGTYPMAASCDHVGPMARTTRDCALAMNVMGGFDAADPWSRRFPAEDFTRDLERPLRGRKIAIAPGYVPGTVASGVAANLERAAATLRELGAEIIPATLPSFDELIVVATFVWVETYAQHAQQLAAHPEAYGADVRAALEMGKGFDTVALVQAQHARERLARAVELAVTDTADALLMPTTPIEAPAIGDEYVTVNGETFPILLLLPGYTLLNNLSRLPTISVPSGLGDTGLPTGVQITTAAGREALALNLAHQLEEALWPMEQRWRDFDRVAAPARA
jgi:aspartyl-tRNA(Asn)/glutamyl-tRNA(Gln) amidotransferase subunit A